MHAGRRHIQMLDEEWAIIEELCASITDSQWELHTDLPGWTVKDILSHIVGIESILLGRTAPHRIDPAPHVRNPIGELNENEVDYRRPRSGTAVLDEFRQVTRERLENLMAISDEELDSQTWTPIGTNTVAVFLRIRVMDCWAHEQDIRRAVDKPGHLDGEIAQDVFGMVSLGIPKAVAKRAAAPDGCVVIFEIPGIDEGTLAVGVRESRGFRLDTAPCRRTRAAADGFRNLHVSCLGPLGPWADARVGPNKDRGRSGSGSANRGKHERDDVT